MATQTALASADSAILRLLGPADGQPASLDGDSWQKIDALASDQRLEPHLHGRLGRGEIVCEVPHDVAKGWAAAYRANALDGLVQRRDLLELCARLHDAGKDSVALKGAWLAWHAYPSPNERVLRDLDLLVSEADAPRAWELMLEWGLQPTEALPDEPSRFAVNNKQFPPLVCSSGTVVELHAHAWEPPCSMEWPTPPTRDDQLLVNAVSGEAPGLRYLALEDMLAHLAIHAAYSHRFEVGPLLLADIDYLLASRSIDWGALWEAAWNGGYARGLALTLAVTDRWRKPGLLEASGCPIGVPNEAVMQASALLLQPSGSLQDTRSFAAFTEARASDGLAKAAAIGFARLGKTVRNPAHMVQRLASSARAAASPQVQRHARSSASIGRWLEEAGQ